MSASKIPPHMVAWLSAEGWTAEELSFAEKKYKEMDIDLSRHMMGRQEHYEIKQWMKITERIETQKGERNREYDSKNKLQRKDPPSWFGEGINRDLFK